MLHLAAALACVTAPISRAQEVALPEASPSASPGRELLIPPEAATPAPTIPPPQLIAPDILPMPDPSAPPTTIPGGTLQELDEVLKPKPISEAADNYRKFVEWRKLRNRVQNDPILKAAAAAPDHARTDLEKRRLTARYFNMLFDKEIALGAPEMKDYINDKRRAFLGALPQPRVRPEPGATPQAKQPVKGVATSAGEAAAGATPTPTPTATPPLGVH